MPIWICCFFIIFFHVTPLAAHMAHQKSALKEWKEEHIPPFDELIFSWNGPRPAQGKFIFYVNVKVDTWSPPMLYASWGSEGQSSFLNTTEEAPVKIYQDTLEVLEGKKATAFQIQIRTEGTADLNSLHGLHVYTNSDRSQENLSFDSCSPFIHLKIPGISQMTLNHVRHKELCSPTSTTAVTRYLSQDHAIAPIRFAENVFDAEFDIFGNWVFNAAQAASLLGEKWDVWVERLPGFSEIYTYLKQGTPVVVSVRGPLKGSAQPYAKGHLLVVVGYDPRDKKVLCMDPAFPIDEETHTSYALADFIEAWSRRGNVAYVFTAKS